MVALLVAAFEPHYEYYGDYNDYEYFQYYSSTNHVYFTFKQFPK